MWKYFRHLGLLPLVLVVPASANYISDGYEMLFACSLDCSMQLVGAWR